MFNAGVRGKRAKDGTGFISSTEQFVQQTYLIPTVTSFSVTDVSYVPLDNTAVNPAGGEIIVINGSGFAPGATVQVGATTIGSVTFIDQNRLAFSAPVLSSGSYTIYVTNSNGGTGILLSGLVYSGLPTFTTTAGTLGTVYETANINTSVVATGDAPITYALLSGTLPAGANINSNGTITGTAPVDGSSTTYSFTIQASDGQLQDSTRAFTLTINTDVLTWGLANNTVYSLDGGTAMSNVTLSATSSANANSAVTYSANTLPTGVSLANNIISGTPTVEQTVYTAVTATATQTGRTATRFVSWIVSLGDLFFDYTTLLIPGASTTFVDDASTNNFAVTINGDTKPNNFNPYTPGYYSGYFDGDGDYLTLGGQSQFAFGAGSFTIEAWIYANSFAVAQSIIDFRPSTVNGFYPSLFINTSGTPYFVTNNTQVLVPTATITLRTWNHIALVKSGSTTTMYLNGVSVGTYADTNTYLVGADSPVIGINGISRNISYFNGYISNLRIVKGTAVYTTAFTPPTTPLTAIANTSLLTCQSNRFIDNSTNNSTLTVAGNTSINSFDSFTPNSSYSTYGSGYFDGTGDYLTTSATPTLLLPETTTSTFECWVLTSSAGDMAIFSNFASASPFSGVEFGVNNGYQTFWSQGTWINRPTGNTGVSNIKNGSWTHLAWVITNNGTTLTTYVNGVQNYTTSITPSTTGNALQSIGSDSNTTRGRYFNGYINDLRFVKGTAVYTSAFTPPSAPLTAITNTSLLTLQNNQPVNNNIFLDNSSVNSLITRSGNTTQGTFSPYGGNWSNYFDGTGDNLSLATATALGTGNTTVEFWFYPTDSSATYRTIYDGRSSVNTDTGYAIFQYGLTIEVYGNGLKVSTSAAAFTINTWIHVALVRTSGTCQLYINGTASGSSATYSSNLNSTVRRIGDSVNTSFPFIGYISNLREVTSAVYSGTFTPSTTPLTPITNTSLLTCADNRLVDDSINNFTITKNGDVSVQRFSPFSPSSVTPKSYSWNLYTEGSLQFSQHPTLSSLSTGAFTVEAWHYPTRSLSSRNVRILSLGRDSAAAAGDTSWDLYISNGSALVWQRIQTTATTYSANYTFNINTWYHIVACRDSSSNLALFVNGTRILLQANVTTNYDFIAGSQGNHYIGATYNNVVFDYAWGYYSNIRVIKGATAYDPTQSTLTVPTSPLSVTAQTSVLLFGNNGSDLSGNYPLSSISRLDSQSVMSTFNPFGFNSELTNGYDVTTVGGSAYFDGTGDYLSIPDSDIFSFGAENFTIQYWINTPSPTTTQFIYGQCNSSALATSRNVGDNITSAGKLLTQTFYSSTAGPSITSSTTFLANLWYHIAIVRSGTTLYQFINGVLQGTANLSTNSLHNSSTTFSIGRLGEYVGSSFIGYISDFHIIRGTALYTASFIPPSAPLTAVQNTVLLNNFTNAAIADYSMMNNMETVGDAKLNTAVSKFGGSSMSFDGTGDCLFQPSNINYGYGTGDFTIEFWLYLNATTLQSIVNNLTAASGASVAPHIYYANASGIRYYVNSADRITGSALSTGVWYHIAVSRSGSSTKMFINGTQTGSTYTDTNNYGVSNPLGVGDYAVPPSGSNTLNGYIDDLRITKGYARYTSNFTAPITSFKTK